MTPEKIRLKFRVSAHAGDAGGIAEAHWNEKWGVGLFEYEEFHVTDQLLKLPFPEPTPKTVCVFAISNGALNFRMVDPDRRAEVNGVGRSTATLTVGDRIRIGETRTVEVTLAPSASASGPAVARARAPELSDIPALEPEDGPTLTLAPTGFHGAPPTAESAPEMLAEPSASPSIFGEVRDRAVEIDEPSFNSEMRAPTSDSRPMPAPIAESRPAASRASRPPEEKLELESVAHAGRDESLELREAHISSVADEASRSDRTLAGFLRSAVARFKQAPSMSTAAAEKHPVFSGSGTVQPWTPEAVTDPGIMAMKDAVYGSPRSSASRKAKLPSRSLPNEPKPWVPEAFSSAARLRGRALVFLLAAVGALAVAVGVFRIQNRVSDLEARGELGLAKPGERSRGIPIEVIEEKVRRMRRSR